MRFLFAFYASLILLKVLINGSDAVSLTSISKLHDIGIDVNENLMEWSD